MKATLHYLEACCAWVGMQADVAEFITHYLHCVASHSLNMMPRALGEITHGMDVGKVLHFNYVNLGMSDKIEMVGHVDGRCDHLSALMDDLSRCM